MSIEITIMQNFDFTKISRKLLQLAGATLGFIGDSYVNQTVERIKRKKLFKSRTGNLIQSIMAVPESETRVVIYGAGKNNFLQYGRFLEFGTKGPYTIRPKERKALKIPTSKGFIFRRKVLHPGIKARHYFFGDYEQKMKTAVEEGRLYFRSKFPEVLND
ncbi:hypothetical protein [Desulfurobacterium crinifex]